MTDYATLFADWLTEKSRQEAHDRFIAQILPWREVNYRWPDVLYPTRSNEAEAEQP